QDLCGAGPAEAQQTVDKWYPHALDTFGAAGSKLSARAVALGIRRWGNEELRQRWKAELGRPIAEAGLRVPDAEKGRQVR
ncbi:MAG: Phenylacetic acid catabolic protein, partial [Burkholderiales bacterium]|nr:Phenylacetic acid catabolic protein [Burkholderiales bacterium]